MQHLISKKHLFFFFAALLFLQGCATLRTNDTANKKTNIIEAHIDLNAVVDDRLVISLDPMPFPNGEVTFYMPSVIPGTYEYSNFGRFVTDFKAFDSDNQLLEVVRENDNTWKIPAGKKLDRISYMVDDTFDSEDGKEIYPMGGTKIEKDEVFLLNLHAMVGYFEGGKEWSYRLTIESPDDLVPFSSLQSVSNTATKDVFFAKRYFNIIDDPILFSEDNSISFNVEGIDVSLAVYSPTGAHDAEDFKQTLIDMMSAQKTFLGEANTTKSYDILLLLMSMEELQHYGGIQGALEHHTSTTVVFFEGIDKESLKTYLTDVVSHEFFHTLTPLNIHSEQIHFFNYNKGVMSKHLWMYEGTTEYFANLFQVQQDLIDEANFYIRISEKITAAKSYDDTMPFTLMSSNIVDKPYADNYSNVYQKGALINMCLDIIIRQQSGGARGILSVMQALAKKYGVDKPFTDNDLCNEIVSMTYPEVKTFIETYIEGETPIPYNNFLAKVGLELMDKEENLPGIILLNNTKPFISGSPNENGVPELVVVGVNNRLEAIGFKAGDVLRVFNGTEIPELNGPNAGMVNQLFGSSFAWTPDQQVTFEVDRNGERIVLAGTVGVGVMAAKEISEKTNATAAQIGLRNAWMHNKR